jgi:hypothetical protein
VSLNPKKAVGPPPQKAPLIGNVLLFYHSKPLYKREKIIFSGDVYLFKINVRNRAINIAEIYIDSVD